MTPSGVKTNLVLKAAGAPTSFVFHLSDPRGLVGNPERQPDGSFVFDQDLGDGYRLGLAPATAYVQAELDGLGAGVDLSSATQTVTRVGDGWDIVLAVAPAWLAGKAFPIVLDPSPVFVAAGSQGIDCHIASGASANNSYCSAATRDVGLNMSKVRRTLTMFSLGSIPDNAVVSSADLDLYLDSTEAATGSIAVQAYRVTQGWNSGATWNSTGGGSWTTAGATYDSSTVLASGTIALTAGHYHLAVAPASVQAWISGANPNYGMVIRASNEATVGVLRFASGLATDLSQRPRLTVTYNTGPSQPLGRSVTPCAAQCASPILTSSATPRLTGHSNDPDGGTLRYDFQVWAGSSPSPTTLVTSGSSPWTPTGVLGSWTVPAGTLTNGQTYEYRVRTGDGSVFTAWSPGWVVFTVDTTAPALPALTSTQYADGGWGAPAAGTISFASSDSSGLAGYSTMLDEEEWTDVTTPTSRALSGLTEGRHTFSVRAQDKAGNYSLTRTWSIGVNVGGIDTPKVEERTAARVTAQASAQSGRDWLRWQYQLGTTGGFTDVPLAHVTTPGTSTHPAAWPIQRSGGLLPPLTWDVGATGGPDGLVQLRACFGTTSTDPSPVCTAGRNVQLARSGTGGSYATTPAGPGTVSLLTGDVSVSESDVDVPSYNGSLSVGRTLTTLSPSTATTGAAGVFGPAWTASLPGPEAGAADQQVEDHASAGYMTLVADDKSQDVYTPVAASGSTTTYAGISDAGGDGSALVKDTGPTPDTLTLTELDGTQTVWSLSGTTWGITRVTEPGASTTSYTRDASDRVTQILAPVPAGVACTTPLTTPGCRTLTLVYATTTTATGTAPAQWGDYTGRLSRVDFTAYDPATSAMATVAVAQYSYDSAGLLRAQWDPRISPALKTTYDYGASNRLTTITPPGLSAWTLGYDGTNRLTTVSRPNPTGGTATTTVRYDVPFTGTGAPLELGTIETAKWAQTDLPAAAAAVWGPDRVPAATPTATDWLYADLTYLNVNGRPVNTASWGDSAWQVATTEYDTHGNTVRSLSAGNRNDALTPAGNPDLDPYVAGITDSATRAQLLSEITRYTADGVDEIDSTGPMHPVVLDDGSLVSARAHTTTAYDQGAPVGGPYRLATSTVVGAQTPDGVDHDARTTLTGYDPIGVGDTSGWTLRQATSTTTDMPGATPDIVKKTRYNPAGQTIETRMPSEPSGGGAGTSLTTYYTAGGTGTCGGKPHWAGLSCQTAPAAQPATGPALPVTTTTYSIWDAPTVVTETAGTTTRTTTTSFDAAGRPTGQSVAVTPAGAGGTTVPDVTTGYDTTTGLPTTTTTSAGVITVGYDAVGQATSYTQTSGGVTITSATRTYDIAGRVATVADGKGTTTYGYDTGTDHRGNLVSTVDTLAGTFTAAYDAESNPETVTYPGGLTASRTYDNDSNPTGLTYAKSGTTWLTFTQTESVHGQIRSNAGPAGEQLYSYDAAARLTRVDDHTTDLTGTTCTRRGYGFDANTNRTSLTTTPAATAAGSATDLCDVTGATPTTMTSSYDTADRATTTGYTYDTLGRTTTVPAAAVTGGTTLTVGYHTNDLVATLTQSGRTKTHTLDPARRILTTTDTAGPTLTNHYIDGSDNPAWIAASDGTWTRTTDAPTGGLAATTDNTSTVTLNLANLHGDLIATAAPTDTTPASYTETTEYGLPRDTSTTNPRYGWLGTHHRNTGDALAQLTLMGIRLYNPTTGRFLSTDPIRGGSCNNYDYSCADPVNGRDLDGKRWCVWRRCFGSRKQPRYGYCGTCYVRLLARGTDRAVRRTRVRVCRWTTGPYGWGVSGGLSLLKRARYGWGWWALTGYCYYVLRNY